MRNVIRVSVLSVVCGIAVVLLTACQPEYRPEAQGERETGAHNFLLQAVNPRPNETALAPEQDGQRGAAAYERYREGKVIVPKKVSTSEVGK